MDTYVISFHTMDGVEVASMEIQAEDMTTAETIAHDMNSTFCVYADLKSE